MKYVLKFKNFSCPPEGGIITGKTVDDHIACGTVKSNQKFDFTLKNRNGYVDFYFVDAQFNNDKN